MATLTITSKGQVTFKKELLKHLNTKPGDRLDVTLLPGGKLQVSAVPGDGIESVFGILAGNTRKKATIEEIGAAAAEAWSGEPR